MARWLTGQIAVPVTIEDYDSIRKYPDERWAQIIRKAMMTYADEMDKMKENASSQFKQTFCNEENRKRLFGAHITVSIPEDEYDRIKKHPEIRWASVARELLIKYLDEYEKFKEAQFKKIPENNRPQK